MKLSTREILEQNAFMIRMGIIQAISSNGGGHIGGALDLAEMLSVIYTDFLRYKPDNPKWSDRDYMIFSKGHSGPALYSALAFCGVLDYEYLNNLNKESQLLPGHCDRNRVEGVDATTGSLGQGLSIACGVALSSKVQEKDQRVYCVVGDGELAEGQIWEAAQFASHFELDNLILFLDNNNMQIDGSVDRVMKLRNPEDKFKAFGWNAVSVAGDDVIAIQRSVSKAINLKNGLPSFISLKTVKGHGLSFVEKLENNHCIGFGDALKNEALIEFEKMAKQLKMEKWFNEHKVYWR